MNNWQDDFFNEDYMSLYRDVLNLDRTTSEVDFLQKIFDSNTRSILDIPCGFGRHSVELAKRGYEVHAVDLYESQLDLIDALSKNLPSLTIEKADMRRYSTSKKFDCVINLFTSFGYYSRDEDRLVMKNLINCAKSNGLIVIDTRNPIKVILDSEKNGWIVERNSPRGVDTEVFDPINFTQHLTYRNHDVVKEAKMNIYTPAEYMQLFNEWNCVVEKIYGDFSGNKFIAEKSPRLILVARKNS